MRYRQSIFYEIVVHVGEKELNPFGGVVDNQNYRFRDDMLMICARNIWFKVKFL